MLSRLVSHYSLLYFCFLNPLAGVCHIRKKAALPDNSAGSKLPARLHFAMSIVHGSRLESQAGQQGVGCPAGFVIVSSKLVKIHLLTGLKQPTSTRVKSSIYPVGCPAWPRDFQLGLGLLSKKKRRLHCFSCVFLKIGIFFSRCSS